MDWPRIATELLSESLPNLSSSRFEPVLAVHMHALAALLQAGRSGAAAILEEETAEDVLLRHEERYWISTASARELKLTDITLRTAAAAAAVFGAADRAEALAITSHLPGLRDAGEDRQMAVAEWVRTLYPGKWWGSLQPDLLAEYLAAIALTDQPGAFVEAGDYASPAQWQQALTVLTRAAERHEVLISAVRELVQQNPFQSVVAAVRVATEAERPGPLIAALDHIVDGSHSADLNVLRLVNGAIPQQTQVHRGLAVRVATKLVNLNRRRAGTEQDLGMPDLARSLDVLSSRLADVGRYEESLAAIQEAVVVRRELVRTDVEDYRPDLAKSLNDLSVRFAELGQREEGLAAIDEAVSMHRQLVDDRGDAFRNDLATR